MLALTSQGYFNCCYCSCVLQQGLDLSLLLMTQCSPTGVRLVVIAVNAICLQSVQGQYEDVRCKCVCPQVLPPNGTELTRKIMVRSFNDPRDW